MKKMILLIATLVTFTAIACADEDKPVQVSQLPQTAQTFLSTHFDGEKVAFAKRDYDFFVKEYEVILHNGAKMEFDSNGNWKSVSCKFSQVPTAIIPEPILKYVKEQWPDAVILEIDRDRRDYEIELNNRIELKFNMQFNLIDYDN